MSGDVTIAAGGALAVARHRRLTAIEEKLGLVPPAQAAPAPARTVPVEPEDKLPSFLAKGQQ